MTRCQELVQGDLAAHTLHVRTHRTPLGTLGNVPALKGQYASLSLVVSAYVLQKQAGKHRG